jgi:hypothetical protein
MTLSELLVVAEADMWIGLGMKLLHEDTGRAHAMLALRRARALLARAGYPRKRGGPRHDA